jgi:hypothetical protein
MKKVISILVIFLCSGAMGLYGKKISHLIAEKPETKTVRFSVFAGTDYSKSLYKNSNAQVVLTIYRYSNDKREVVWEGVIDKGSIKNYPVEDNSIVREVSVYNVYERNETIAAIYKVVYDYKGYKMSYEEGIPLTHGSAADSLKIRI